MNSAMYGKVQQDTINRIIEAAGNLGGSDEQITRIRTVSGNNARLQQLNRLKALADLMENLEPVTIEVEPGGFTLDQIMAVDGLTKTSKEALQTALAPEPEEETAGAGE